MNKKILTATSFALTAGAAFIAGRTSAPADSSSDSTVQNSPPPRPGRPGIARSSDDSASEKRSKSTSSRTPRGSQEVSALMVEMSEILGSSDPLTRTQAWLDFVSTLEPGQFESVIHEFRSQGMTNGHMGEYAMILTAWAKTDPLQALDYAKENTGNSFARNTILASWAGTDPNGAIQWAKSNHEGDDANPWMVGVIRGIAANDPTLATSLMTDMPRSGERGEALEAVLPAILLQGPDAARDWASNIEDESLRDGAIRRLSEDLARTDPEGTANWLAANPGEGSQRSMDDVIGIWAKQDEQAATSYFKGLPSGDLKTSALRGLANQMAMENPSAAADFIDTHQNDASDRVYQQFVWHSFGQDPSLAADYIGRIQNANERDGTYRRMLDGWLRRDYESAVTWIGSNELPENVAGRVERRIQEIEQRRQ